MKITCFILSLLVIWQFLICSGKERQKPDILLIMPDQMRGDCLSILGHPVVRTPQLDELARQGVLFRRAYTTVPSCIPARYALLTGLYPQTSGVVGYKEKTISVPTLPAVLAQAGYATVLVGRNMHQNEESGSLGYAIRILGSTYVADDDYDHFLRKSEPKSEGIRKLVEDLGLTFNWWQAKPWPLASHLHPSEWIVSESCRIVQQTDLGQPLFLTASFYAPHPPLFPPKKYFDTRRQQDLPAVAMGEWVNWRTLSPEGDNQGHRVLLEGEILRNVQAGYFGLIEHLDDQISILIQEFKQRSERAGRSWIIIVISDHGEMLGDHGFFRKCEPYEGSANIPFIMCASPELGFKAGLRIDQPVCLEDIMPTLLTQANLKIPTYLDGVNLLPTLQGKEQVIREWLHFEHATCYSEEQAFHALTDGHVKYIWRPVDGTEQLFDLDKDGKEEHDLSKSEDFLFLLKQWRGRLVKRLSARSEGFSQDGNLISGRPYPPINGGVRELKAN